MVQLPSCPTFLHWASFYFLDIWLFVGGEYAETLEVVDNPSPFSRRLLCAALREPTAALRSAGRSLGGGRWTPQRGHAPRPGPDARGPRRQPPARARSRGVREIQCACSL